MSVRRALSSAAALALLLALSACDAGDPSPAASSTGTPTPSVVGAVVLEDGWVKAAESGMSAAFGEVVNSTGADVTVVSVSTPASTSTELHETVQDDAGQMVMREKEGGFTVAAGESLSLAPGGNHLMLMGLVGPLQAGDEVDLTLTLADGTSVDATVPVKDYSGANETYEGGEDMEMGGH